ncbi:D-sedoheptulose-7-phosphate isomerase [Facklamia miroungae]|uniref:D-sedoheptulose 7-phosphate isomerase n=1 Tax=Facklamia miroungae TaxID=120956 RepID=A0A1G7UCP4_9LACT|nr:SIS domain-containing protein [Facklamia miroungae]SDG44809.1 D-sedoheptulose 7-phosphate isomerase [Facklamia miroungae]
MDYEIEFKKRTAIFDDIANNRSKDLKHLSNLIFNTIKSGNKIMTVGNGGSAANAQHITGDIIGRYKIERSGFPAISLTVDPSVMTATANDYGYENVFARQVEGLGNENDLLIVLSSSAHSENIVRAAHKANEMGIQTVGVLGNTGGTIAEALDYSINFAFKESDLVEEAAMTIFHIILIEVEQKLVKLREGDGNVN